ncbi:MAG TPA: NAD(P)/FAD-dependent oxidoreductase [Solirubrobacteraceae bacterium]|jgi:cation diffusion facilitator CzcD-associated flavoprotein CzcO|nr:NAD(P)/FAD-dependent oxidoreductase [Solirubrobacteraceae bacterium]
MGATTAEGVDHVDVLIIGAGFSGIGCAYYLQQQNPQRSYAILEARSGVGGTWDLFKFPGIRSDSDLHTFCLDFKPWESEYAIASGAEILDYIREAAREHGIDQRIRTDQRVVSLSWSSAEARWLAEIQRTDTGMRTQMTANWVFAGTGYYRYDGGYLPDLPGIQNYLGRIVHPQQWPQNMDHSGKRIVVVGSGATAVTLIPALAKSAEHVAMLQRSPSYILSLPSKDAIANMLMRWLGPKRGYAWTRRKNIAIQTGMYRFCQRCPKQARKLIRWLTIKQLPAGYPVDVHFNPRYDPWDQRLCFVPDGDLFRSIREGKASIVTDQIETFTPNGIRLESGRELVADIIVTATGLRLQAFGGIEMYIDGERVDISKKIAFRGMMLDGVPNLAFLIGYTNASWTLKVGLVCRHFCRLLEHMDKLGADTCVVELPYPHMETRPLLDFAAGYVQRSLDELPRQGMHSPWELAMSVATDVKVLEDGPLEDRNLHFLKARESETEPEAAGAAA